MRGQPLERDARLSTQTLAFMLLLEKFDDTIATQIDPLIVNDCTRRHSFDGLNFASARSIGDAGGSPGLVRSARSRSNSIERNCRHKLSHHLRRQRGISYWAKIVFHSMRLGAWTIGRNAPLNQLRNPPVTVTGTARYEGRHRLSVAHLLTAIVVMFVVAPFVDRFAYGKLAESAAFSLVLVAAVSAVGGQRRTFIAAAVIALPALLTRWLDHLWPGLMPIEVSLIAGMVFVAFVIWHLFRFVISAPAVNAEVLCAAISIYLLAAVAWGFLYTILARSDPNAFTFTEPSDAKAALAGFLALYYSIQVLTTITFGDILPVSSIARMVTLVEATVGVFYLAIMISRLVGLYSSAPPSRTTPT
jgi:hypothetical protein